MSDETSNPPRTYLPRVKSSCRPSAELAHALRIDANNLAVKDGVLDGQLGQRPLECLKPQVPLIARNQLRLAILQVRDRPETVVFQLEHVIGMVEGLPHETEPHRVNARDHNFSLSLRFRVPAPPLRTRLLQLPLEHLRQGGGLRRPPEPPFREQWRPTKDRD